MGKAERIDTLSDAYRIDRLTAEFIFPETEREFRGYIRASRVRDTRQAIVLAALFYLMFAVTDFLVMGSGEEYLMVLANRVGVCAVGLTAAFLADRYWWQLVNGLIPTVVVATALAAFIVKTMMVPLEYGVHGMGMMAMLLGVYVFIPNRFIAALAVSVPASVVFLLTVTLHYGLPFGQLATLMAMLVVTNVLGAMAAWRISILTREEYCDTAVLMAANQSLLREAEERLRLEAVLRQRAEQDEATGIANRSAFFETAGGMLARAEETRAPLSLILVEVDYFKQLNGTYGHTCGDEVLKALVEVCRAVMAPGQFLARFGGEEFVALLPHTDLAEAADLAERIRAECQRMPVTIADVMIHFTVSVGAVQRRANEPVGVILRRADEAVSVAKYKGRNRIEAAA
jgi:diguanylate cyclase (GGDEF)-like protein